MTDAAPATRNETSAVREAHRFDIGALQTYMQRHVDGFHGALDVFRQLGGFGSGRKVQADQPCDHLPAISS